MVIPSVPLRIDRNLTAEFSNTGHTNAGHGRETKPADSTNPTSATTSQGDDLGNARPGALDKSGQARSVIFPTQRALARQVRKVLAEPSTMTSVFQPIVSLETGRIVGFEALARMVTELNRAPVAMIRRAHAIGVGPELEAVAVHRALEVATSANIAPDVFLSVNVSPLLVGHPALWEVLGSRDLRTLVLELTEDDAVDDYRALRRAMRRYLDLGVRFAIDDAGAGFASMRHLTELWPTFFKLDALLTRRLGRDERRQALVRALAMLAADVGATLIVEGVERPSDLMHLAQTGLPIWAQGYVIARPGVPWPRISPLAERTLQVPAVHRDRIALAGRLG